MLHVGLVTLNVQIKSMYIHIIIHYVVYILCTISLFQTSIYVLHLCMHSGALQQEVSGFNSQPGSFCMESAGSACA